MRGESKEKNVNLNSNKFKCYLLKSLFTSRCAYLSKLRSITKEKVDREKEEKMIMTPPTRSLE